MDAYRFVAHNIMEYKQKKCEGRIGWGQTGGGTSASGFYCAWCGQARDYSMPVPNCPASPIPDFDIVDLMRKLGNNNYPIMLRFDHVRERNRFTLVGPEGRIADTDEPFEELIQHCYRVFGPEHNERRCRVCGK